MTTLLTVISLKRNQMLTHHISITFLTTQFKTVVLMTALGLQINFTIHQVDKTVTTQNSGGFLNTPLMMDKIGQLQIFFTRNTHLIFFGHPRHHLQQMTIGLRQILLELISK